MEAAKIDEANVAILFCRRFCSGCAAPRRYYRILTIEPSENVPDRKPTLDEIKNKLVEVTKDDSIVLSDPKWFSYANLNMGIAPALIDRRVILAGDAGNPILPNGGQGLNTGIQDSFNLAWKLAAVLRGEAKPALLKTYEEERLTLRGRYGENTI